MKALLLVLFALVVCSASNAQAWVVWVQGGGQWVQAPTNQNLTPDLPSWMVITQAGGQWVQPLDQDESDASDLEPQDNAREEYEVEAE